MDPTVPFFDEPGAEPDPDPTPEIDEQQFEPPPAASIPILVVAAAPPRGRRRRLAAVAILLAVVTASLGYVAFGPGADAEAAVYRRIFKARESHTYAFSMTMDGSLSFDRTEQPLDMTMGMRIGEETMAVGRDGVATLKQHVEALDVTLNGVRVPVPFDEPAEITVRMGPDGKVLDVQGSEVLSLAQTGPATDLFGPGSMSPLLPSGRVAPGDSWVVESEVPQPLSSDPVRVTARNRLVSRKTVDGIDVAVIRSQIDVPMDIGVELSKLLELAPDSEEDPFGGGMPLGAVFRYDGSMSMSLVQTIEAATGRPLAVVGTGTADLRVLIEGLRFAEVPPMRMRMNVDVTFDRVDGTGTAS